MSFERGHDKAFQSAGRVSMRDALVQPPGRLRAVESLFAFRPSRSVSKFKAQRVERAQIMREADRHQAKDSRFEEPIPTKARPVLPGYFLVTFIDERRERCLREFHDQQDRRERRLKAMQIIIGTEVAIGIVDNSAVLRVL